MPTSVTDSILARHNPIRRPRRGLHRGAPTLQPASPQCLAQGRRAPGAQPGPSAGQRCLRYRVEVVRRLPRLQPSPPDSPRTSAFNSLCAHTMTVCRTKTRHGGPATETDAPTKGRTASDRRTQAWIWDLPVVFRGPAQLRHELARRRARRDLLQHQPERGIRVARRHHRRQFEHVGVTGREHAWHEGER